MNNGLINFITKIMMIAFISISALASETDNISRRDLKSDSRDWLNQQMNEAIHEAVTKADPKVPYSVHQRLYRSLGGLFWAKIEKWVDAPESTGEHLKFEDSIFRDVGDVRGNSSLVRRLFKFRSYYSSGIYKMDDIVFGADKLGHFLQLGYTMYLANGVRKNPNFKDVRPFYIRAADLLTGDKKFREQTKSEGIDLAVEYSAFEENGSWGMKGPMAKSWADMTANVEGFKFWSELTGGANPYVKRDANGKWYQARQFDWATYVNPAWDEAVNRTDYDIRMQTQIEKRFDEALKNSKSELPGIQKIFDIYGDNAIKLFNNKCEKVFVW